MQCERCKKSDAKIHFTKIINNETTEFHLCDGCAREMKVVDDNHVFHLENLISGLAHEGETPASVASAEPQLACPACGLNAAGFKRTGRLGCARCYETFRDDLMPLLRKIHGSAQHTGKTPARVGVGTSPNIARDIKKLRRELREAISREEYERAAQVRDEIKKVEAEMDVPKEEGDAP